MAIDWSPITDENGFGTIPARIPVLLIAKYPNSNTWSDPVYGWRERMVERPEREFARWHHDFPPTHFAWADNVPED